MMTGLGWAMGLGGWLWMVLGIAIVLVVAWAATAVVADGHRRTIDGAARILSARLARGEISQAEYEQAKRLLEL
jgi:uncharacterized membrane protein